MVTTQRDEYDPIRVLIADDHAMVREGLKLYLGFHPAILVVGEATNGLEAVEKTTLLRPHLVLMDLMMPVLDGTAATRELLKRHPQVRVIALTSSLDSQATQAVLAAGAVVCLLKTTQPEALLTAILATEARP